MTTRKRKKHKRPNCIKIIDGREIIDADKFIGPIDISYMFHKANQPFFVNNGSGNGWLVSAGGIRWIYIR